MYSGVSSELYTEMATQQVLIKYTLYTVLTAFSAETAQENT